MVTPRDPSSRRCSPTKIKSAVMSPPMIAATNAVSMVLRESSFRGLPPSRLPGLRAEAVDSPPVYLPPAVLLHEPPGSFVLLDLVGERGLGATCDGRRIAEDLGGRPLDELYALHLVERTREGGPVRERTLPPTLAEKLGSPVVIPRGGRRVELLYRPLGSFCLRRSTTRLALIAPSLVRRSLCGGRLRRGLLAGACCLLVRLPLCL